MLRSSDFRSSSCYCTLAYEHDRPTNGSNAPNHAYIQKWSIVDDTVNRIHKMYDTLVTNVGIIFTFFFIFTCCFVKSNYFFALGVGSFFTQTSRQIVVYGLDLWYIMATSLCKTMLSLITLLYRRDVHLYASKQDQILLWNVLQSVSPELENLLE